MATTNCPGKTNCSIANTATEQHGSKYPARQSNMDRNIQPNRATWIQISSQKWQQQCSAVLLGVDVGHCLCQSCRASPLPGRSAEPLRKALCRAASLAHFPTDHSRERGQRSRDSGGRRFMRPDVHRGCQPTMRRKGMNLQGSYL